MPKIISIIVLVILIALFPPAVLAMISQNALPGDFRYPIKRKLEDGILLLASLNPTSRAWFAVSRSNTRFKEATGLLNKGQNASEVLTELILQTDSAFQELDQVSDIGQKSDLAGKLSDSITQYDKGLQTAQQNLQTKSETTANSKTTTQTVIQQNSQQTQIDSVRKQLEELQRKLEEERRRLEQLRIQRLANPPPRNGANNPPLRPSPRPSLSPSPRPSPSPSSSPSVAQSPRPSPSAAAPPVGSTHNCEDDPIDPPHNQSVELTWKAFCSQTCTSNNDCPKNFANPIIIPPGTSNKCYTFSTGPRCLQLQVDH